MTERETIEMLDSLKRNTQALEKHTRATERIASDIAKLTKVMESMADIESDMATLWKRMYMPMNDDCSESRNHGDINIIDILGGR